MTSVQPLQKRRLTQHGFGATARRDGWWVAPLLTFLGLATFIVYSTWAAFQAAITTPTAPISRRSTRPSSSATRRTAGSVPKPGLVAELAAVVARVPHPVGPGRLPADVLLLPRRLLQGVLGRSAVVHVGEPRNNYLRRELVPAHPAERPPLLPLHRARVPGVPGPTTPGRPCGSRTRDGTDELRHRRRHAWCSPPT